MFYHIEGLTSEINPNYAVLDCNGIGFFINITPNTASALKTGELSKLYVSEAIGESNFDLYGFLTKQEKRCFEMLITVSGIGPKAAMSVLSYNSPDTLAAAIINNDEKCLTAAPGIGKKTALRIILELKDKFGKDFAVDSITVKNTSRATDNKALNDAYAALLVLGYSNSDITKALSGIDIASMSTEQIIRAALKSMDK